MAQPIKHHLLASILLLTFLGCSQQPQSRWKPILDGGHNICRNNATIFAFAYNDDPEHSVVLFFPFNIGSRASHDSNPVSQTFNYSGTINNIENKIDVLKYEVSSVNPALMTCNGTKYDLGAGTVFHVDANGRLSQVPFVGLKPTMDYVDTLQQYFAANPATPAALLATEPDEQSP